MQTGEDWVEREEVGLQTGLVAVILWLQAEQREEEDKGQKYKY